MALIDDARRLFFEGQGNKFQSRYILAVTYMPPSPRLNKLNDLMFEQDKTAPKDDVLTKNLSRFKQSLQNLISRLNSYLSITRLGAVYDKAANCYYDTMLSYLNFTVTGHWHPIRLPPCPMAIDSYIGCCDFYPTLRLTSITDSHPLSVSMVFRRNRTRNFSPHLTIWRASTAGQHGLSF